MGFAYSKAVNFSMGTKKEPKKHRPHCKSKAKKRHRTALPSTTVVPFWPIKPPLQRKPPDGPLLGRDRLSKKTKSKSSVLIVESNDISETSVVSQSRVRVREKRTETILKDTCEDIQEIEAHLANFPVDNEPLTVKLRKFAIAWRAGLAYRHGKIETVSTGIPVAATSYCRKTVSRWKRYGRHYCLWCSYASWAEHILDDLLHQDSLERLLYEAEHLGAASSIVIKHDLKRMRLFESVHYSEEEPVSSSSPSSSDEDEVSEDKEMTVEIKLHLPTPVHIDITPEDVQRLPPAEELHKNYWQHTNKTMHTNDTVSVTRRVSTMSLNQSNASAFTNIKDKVRRHTV